MTLDIRAAALAAKRELMRRESARSGLLGFTRYTKRGYIVGQHHRLICEKLDGVLEGRIKRLMIMAPPRHGKSELATRRFPALFMGRHPTSQLIVASASDSLAKDFGMDVRNIIADEKYKTLFPETSLSADTRAKDRWNTSGGGIFVSSSIGGSIIGRGANCLLIDDPFKNREDANSEARRKAVWSWYASAASTRLMPGGSVIVTNTRWHDGDLSGLLLELMAEGGDQWDLLNLPAIAEPDGEFDELGRREGEALWPERYPLPALESIRMTSGEVEWASQYQQRPAPEEGAIFQPNEMPVLQQEPENCVYVRAWDIAATKQTGSKDPDWTVGLKMARTKMGRWIIVDIRKVRGAPQAVEELILNTAKADGKKVPIVLPGDPGAMSKGYGQILATMLAGYNVKIVQDRSPKETRAAPFAAQMNIGNIAMLAAPWNEAFKLELQYFPSGKHDDMVDAGSSAFAFLGTRKRRGKLRGTDFNLMG